jgi:hypothetical protein
MHHVLKVLAKVLALTFFLHPLAVSAQAQEEEGEQKKPVALFEATVPSPVTTDGGVAIVKFHCDRSLEGEKLGPRFLLSTPKISGPPDRYGGRSTFLLRGERSIGVEIFKCLDDKCRKKGSLSNHLTLDVVFT